MPTWLGVFKFFVGVCGLLPCTSEATILSEPSVPELPGEFFLSSWDIFSTMDFFFSPRVGCSYSFELLCSMHD